MRTGTKRAEEARREEQRAVFTVESMEPGDWAGLPAFAAGAEDGAKAEGSANAAKRPKLDERVEFRTIWACPDRKKKEDVCSLCENKGCIVQAIKPINPAEYYVVVLERSNGSNKYLCLDCGHRFQGTPQRIIAHKLRIQGRGVAQCKCEPAADVLARLTKLDEEASSRHKPRKTLGRAGGSDDYAQKGGPDVAIARFMYECDVSFQHALHPAFKRMIKLVSQAGPNFQPPDPQMIQELLTSDISKRAKAAPRHPSAATREPAATGAVSQCQASAGIPAPPPTASGLGTAPLPPAQATASPHLGAIVPSQVPGGVPSPSVPGPEHPPPSGQGTAHLPSGQATSSPHQGAIAPSPVPGGVPSPSAQGPEHPPPSGQGPPK